MYVDRQASDHWESTDAALPAAVCSRTSRVQHSELCRRRRYSPVAALHLSGQRAPPEPNDHRGAVLCRPHWQCRDRQYHPVHNAAGRGGVRGPAAWRRHRRDDRVFVYITVVQLIPAVQRAVECHAVSIRRQPPHGPVWRGP